MRSLRYFLARHGRSVALLIVLGFVMWYVPSGYLMSMPGSALPVSPMVTVVGEDAAPAGAGEVMLTTVYTQDASLGVALFGLIYPRAQLRPKDLYLREDEDFDDYLERTRQMMEESQNVAKYVAMSLLGMDAAIDGDGVEVVSVRSDAPAAELLEVGDLVLGAAGSETRITDDLQSVVAGYDPGDVIELVIRRGDEIHNLEVTLMASPDDGGRTLVGIGVVTRNPHYRFPMEVEIDAGNIGGPSAGLAFVLDLMNQMAPELELLGGLRVACTGTVDARGRVGSVGGVALKVWAAQRARADVFVVPRSNYQDALDAGADIKIVPVDTVEEALDLLQQHVNLGNYGIRCWVA